MASRQLQVVLSALDNVASLVIRKIVLDIVANLKAAPSEGGTPRDTGWAAANWIPVIGDAGAGRANRPGDDAQTRSAAQQLGAQQEQAVAAVAATYHVSQGKVTIANNVPYIVRLNEGSSAQQPSGFVQRAVAKAVKVDLRGIST